MDLDDKTLTTLLGLDVDDERHRPAIAEALPLVVERLRELARERLLAHLEGLSSKYAHNSWAPGIEVATWRAIEEGPEMADEEEINLAEKLAEEAGGWWHRPDDSPAEFLPLHAWREKYAELSQEHDVVRLRRTIRRLEEQLSREGNE